MEQSKNEVKLILCVYICKQLVYNVSIEVLKMNGYVEFKNYLAEQRIKQEEVANLIGISRSQLNMILNGQRGNDFYASQVVKICNHYKISADKYFFIANV